MLYAFLLILSGSLGQQTSQASPPSSDVELPVISAHGQAGASAQANSSSSSSRAASAQPSSPSSSDFGYDESAGGWGEDAADSSEVAEQSTDEVQPANALKLSEGQKASDSTAQPAELPPENQNVSWSSIMMYLTILAILVAGTAWAYRRV